MTGLTVRLSGLHDGVPLHTSERKRAYVVAADNGSYIRLSEAAYQLLLWLNQGLTVEEIALRLNRAGVDGVVSTELDARCQELVARLVKLTSTSPRSASAGFTFRFRLIPESVVRSICRGLTGAFRPWGVAALTMVLAVAALRASTYHIRAADTSAHIGTAVMLALLSLFIHEFGHAAACARFGAQPHEIGAGVYLLYPAFYSNVSDAWRLTRWQRVVVDLGGIYFQALTAAAFVGIYELTGYQSFRASLFLIFGSFLFTLNPFFKFDGYWVISDALGVTNLRDQWRRFLVFARDSLRHRHAEPLPWSKPITAAVIVCSICSCALWLRFVLNVGPALWMSVHLYALDLAHSALLVRRDPSAFTIRQAISFFGRTYLFACTLRIAWQCAQKVRTSCGRALPSSTMRARLAQIGVRLTRTEVT